MKISDFAKRENISKPEVEEELKKTGYFDSYEKFKDMDTNQLMQSLLSEVNKQKGQGTFDINSLQSSINSILPYIDAEQKQNLMSILEKIK